MAATNRTPNLGLNSWLDTDRPKRTDFVSDNNIIDSFLGTHLSDSTAHLTQSEKDKVGEPFKVSVLYGTGETTSLRYDFNPSFVIAFRIDAPTFEYTNSKNMINSAYASTRGASMGMAISGNTVFFYQGAIPDTDYYNNMSEEHSQYIVIAFK